MIVSELLAGPITVGYNSFGIQYGATGLDSKSFHNLRRRMISLGFLFRRDDRRITMSFPEMDHGEEQQKERGHRGSQE